MLRIKSNPQKKPAQDATFESPTTNQKNGIEMLIALNMTPKIVLTGPEVSIDSKILVTKEHPHFFFNPIITEPKDLQSKPEDSTIYIQYKDYAGTEQSTTIADEDGSISAAIDQLHNGIKRAQRKKV